MKTKIANSWKTKGVYSIYCTANDTYYIGSGGINSRLSNHLKLLEDGKHTNIHLQNSWNKHGKDSFISSILEESMEDLIIRETYHIKEYLSSNKKLFNIQLNPSDISGENNPMWGRKHSEESKIKNAKSHLGKIASDATRKLMSSKSKGRKHTKQFKDKLSVDRMGSLNPSAKISEEIVVQIKKDLQDGIKPCQIAKNRSIGYGTIYNIRSGRSWANVGMKENDTH